MAQTPSRSPVIFDKSGGLCGTVRPPAVADRIVVIGEPASDDFAGLFVVEAVEGSAPRRFYEALTKLSGRAGSRTRTYVVAASDEACSQLHHPPSA
jgi:hypothetical protein